MPILIWRLAHDMLWQFHSTLAQRMLSQLIEPQYIVLTESGYTPYAAFVPELSTDFWGDLKVANERLWQLISNVDLLIEIDEFSTLANSLYREVTSKCSYDPRFDPQWNAANDHFWKCTGCNFCDE